MENINQDETETKPMNANISITPEQQLNMLLGQVAKYAEENARLKLEAEARAKEDRSTRQVILKVSEKGGVTFNAPGLRRFGVTLYEQEWAALFPHIDEIKAFVERNSSKLSKLPQK